MFTIHRFKIFNANNTTNILYINLLFLWYATRHNKHKKNILYYTNNINMFCYISNTEIIKQCIHIQRSKRSIKLFRNKIKKQANDIHIWSPISTIQQNNGMLWSTYKNGKHIYNGKRYIFYKQHKGSNK